MRRITSYCYLAALQVLVMLGICLMKSESVQAQALVEEKPLLTLACISDIHTERGLITDINNIGIRGSFAQTLNRIKSEEKIDVLLLGGDCTSDATIPQANWEKVRQLIANYSRKAFQDGSNTPVLYVTGNHDYEVANWYDLPKSYNAGDYYTYPMKEDIGELTADEAFYEKADNADMGQMSLLAAYHYVIHGFDFVILNCGKYQFKDAGHYEYSVESVQWVANKLAEIYAADPEKTVFFALHIPFGDSNSIRSASKGIVSSAGEKLLKSTLAKYPNLIMLYGHDHGEDKAYTRKKTSQRVTHYDKNGAVINTYDENHVDGSLPEGYIPEDEAAEEAPAFYFFNTQSSTYIGYDSYNIAPISTPKAITVTTQSNGALLFDIEGSNPSGGSPYNYIHIGSNGYYSVGDATGLYLYEASADGTEGTLATFPEAEHSYMIVGEKSGKWYALSNSLYNAGGSGQRMQRVEVTRSSDGAKVTLSTANPSILWTAKETEATSVPEVTGTWSVFNEASGLYLGFNSLNISAVAQAAAVTFEVKNASTSEFSVKVTGSGSEANGNYLYSGSSGRFSANTNYCPSYLYRVTQMDDTSIKAELASEIEEGEKYVIVVRNNNNQTQYYAVTSEIYNGNRLVGLLVTRDGNEVTLKGTDTKAVWTISTYVTPEADASFFSAFMGSMRYYYNTISLLPTPSSKVVSTISAFTTMPSALMKLLPS